MAQRFVPLYITNNFRIPPILSGSTILASRTDEPNVGAGLGIPRGFIVDPKPVAGAFYWLVPNSGDFASADIDVLLNYQQHGFGALTGYEMGLVVRGSRASLSAPVHGYYLSADLSRDGHRGLSFQRLGGTTTQTFVNLAGGSDQAFGSTRNFLAGGDTPPARNLRINITGTSVRCYCYWDDDIRSARIKNLPITLTSNIISGAGAVGIYFKGSAAPQIQFNFISFANGTDQPLVELPARQLDGVLYQPRDPVSGSTTVPASGFPVRAYHRATGTPVGSDVTAANGTYSITSLDYGAQESILTGVDTVDDNQEWGGAIEAPVTPTVTVTT